MRPQRGFTLLEVLVVLSLLGLLLVFVSQQLSDAGRTLQRVQTQTGDTDEVRAAHRFLEQALEQMLPLSRQAGDLHNAHLFSGQPQQMAFVAPLPASLGGGLYVHELRLDRQQLWVRFLPLPGSGGATLGPDKALLHRVRALAFAYRGLSPQGKPTGWQAGWPWPDRLPQSIRITASLGGPVPWTTQVITLRLSLSGEAP